MRTMLLLVVGSVLAIPGELEGQDIGGLTLQGGTTIPIDPDESVRAGFNGSITFVVGRFALGPELGWYFTAGPEHSPSRRPENVVTVGAVTRYDLTRGRWRPFLVGGAGVQYWESTREGYPTDNAWELSGGVGLRQAITGWPLAVSGELRGHTSLQSSGLQRRTFMTATVGLSWRW